MHAATARAESSSTPAPEGRPPAPDVREALLAGLGDRLFAFRITATEPARLAGTRRLAALAAGIGVRVDRLARDGEDVRPGDAILEAHGTSGQVARAEEQLIAPVAKASGVATAAARLAAHAGARARVVCGAWKKVPAEVRDELRAAAGVGGVGVRMLDTPFVYVDKNHVRMLGGVAPAVRRARTIPGRAVVVQLRGDLADVADEARQAIAEGAAVLMVDTGRIDDLAAVAHVARGTQAGEVTVAFGGNVGLATLAEVIEAGASIVDVGRAILDAPMADLRLDVA